MAVEDPRGHRPVYLDHNATTPVDERVVEAMVESLSSNYGNAASRHEVGAKAEAAVKEARKLVASLINADPDDIYFTSGATEANNLVIGGAAGRRGNRNRIVISAVEHPSVLEPAEALASDGVAVHHVLPNADGRIAPSAVEAAVDDATFLVSIMLANNEIGTISPVGSYAAAVHERGALLHSDATQAVGHIGVDVKSLGVDLLSLSAHKLYGPKGVGAIFIRRKARRRIAPRMLGGGHERGMRSGTLNVPAIVGFGVAASIARREMVEAEKRVACLRDLLLRLLRDGIGEVHVNGSLEHRLPGNLNVFLPGVDAEALVVRLKRIAAFSTGAACSSTKVGPSHVIQALSDDPARAFSSVRFGVGRGNTEDDICLVAQAVSNEASLLRTMSRT